MQEAETKFEFLKKNLVVLLVQFLKKNSINLNFYN